MCVAGEKVLMFFFPPKNYEMRLGRWWGGQAFLLSKFWIWGEFCSRKLSDIFFYRTDIPHSTHTISEHNLIKWCQWEHLLDQILKGLRVRGAGLKLSIGSMDDLLCCWCMRCYAWLNNNGTKLAFLSDIFVLTYSFWLVPKLLRTKNEPRAL